jgi:site-specific DNA-cytosine methylase
VTIEKYRDRYESGRYGWKRLDWDVPAPSFGSVAKTYILHPDSWENGRPARVLSVREVLSLLGFSRDFRFPPGTPLHHRYRMVANAVSPIFALACANAVRTLLTGDVPSQP